MKNTVLASELVNVYHKNRRSKRITIKVDIAKAFDTLSWDFLFAALDSLDFRTSCSFSPAAKSLYLHTNIYGRL